MKDKYGSKHSSNNSGKSDADSGSMGSNKGASTGLRQESKLRADTLKAPSNTNRFPNGMA